MIALTARTAVSCPAFMSQTDTDVIVIYFSFTDTLTAAAPTCYTCLVDHCLKAKVQYKRCFFLKWILCN